MRIVLKDENTEKKYEIPLIARDVKIAKKLINDFLNSVKKHSEEEGAPTLLFTTLIMMHLISQDQLKAITPKTADILLTSAYKSYKRNKNKSE